MAGNGVHKYGAIDERQETGVLSERNNKRVIF